MLEGLARKAGGVSTAPAQSVATSLRPAGAGRWARSRSSCGVTAVPFLPVGSAGLVLNRRADWCRLAATAVALGRVQRHARRGPQGSELLSVAVPLLEATVRQERVDGALGPTEVGRDCASPVEAVPVPRWRCTRSSS